MRPIMLAALLCCVAWTAHAKIPQPVIDNCNSTVESYDEMPKCLKAGSVAFEMLGIALQDSYYGPHARKIIYGCWKENGEYYRTWMCFMNVAKKAVETRDLIGLENIKDKCYAMLSNSRKLEKLDTTFEQTKRKLVDERHFYWSQHSRPFKGCPDQAKQNNSDTEGRSAEKNYGRLSDEACLAYNELDTILAQHSSLQLETMITTLKAAPGRERLKGWKELGLSEASYKYLRSADRKETGLVLGAIIINRQPELLERVIIGEIGKENSLPSSKFGERLMDKMLQNAFIVYKRKCEDTS